MKTIVDEIKNGKEFLRRDALKMWNAYGQTYYHELMHFPGLINETYYEHGSGNMGDIIKPYPLSSAAYSFGTRGKKQYEAGHMTYLSTMYLRESFSSCSSPFDRLPNAS